MINGSNEMSTIVAAWGGFKAIRSHVLLGANRRFSDLTMMKLESGLAAVENAKLFPGGNADSVAFRIIGH